MKKKRLLININTIMVACMFIMLHDLSFLPDTFEQAIKISFIIILFIYNAKHISLLSMKKPFFWLLLSAIISIGFGYITSAEHSINVFIKGVIFLVSIFNVVQLINYQFHRDNVEKMLKALFFINLIYCIIAFIFINKVIRITNVGSSSYMFGSKFSTSYLFVSLACLFYMVYNKKIKDMMRYRLIFLFFNVLTAYVAFHLNCMTVVGIAIVPLVMGSIRGKAHDIIYDWRTIILLIAISTLFPFFMEMVLNINFIQRLVVGFFERDLTLSSRMKVYSRYLVPVIRKHIILGYGYSNNAMKNISNYYQNAQNGLLNYVIQFGTLGAGILVAMITSTFRSVKPICKNHGWLRGAVMLLVAMIVAGAVEVSYNWHFFLALSLLYVAQAYYSKTRI